MNWIKTNKFLAVFFAVMLIGIGALGFFLFSAMGQFDAATEEYSGQASELNRLQNLPLYPNKKNLDVLVGQKKEAVDAIEAFQASLVTRQFPLEPMTPEGFQDKLKATKSAVLEKAAQANVKLVEAPEKFFLGFEAYESRPPDKDAAPGLARQLKAIEWVLEQLIANQIVLTKPIKREELPEEKGRKAAADKKNRPLVAKYPFQINVKCRQMGLSRALNAIAGPKAPQFYIPRNVRVKNEKDKGPLRAVAEAAIPAPAPAPAGAAPVPGAPAPVPAPAIAAPVVAATYIVGEEQLDAELVIEVVEFAEPAASKPGK